MFTAYNRSMSDPDERRRLLEEEIERRLSERFAALRDEFQRLRLESDGRWSGFASRFEQKISGIVPAELLASGPGERRDGEGRLSIDAARELDGASTQVEILQRLLDLCRRHASRAILLVLREGVFGVWKAVGLPGGTAAETMVRQAPLPADSQGALARVAEGFPVRLAAGNEVSTKLSCSDTADAVLVPMSIREKVSGALYADAAPGEEDRFDPESVAFLAFLSGLFVERLPGRKLKPFPALRLFERASRPPSTSLDEYERQMVSLWKEVSPSAPAEPEPERRPAEQTPPAPAPGRRLTGPLAPPDDEERQMEARRFAQLLVSEIKLYNDRAVEEGRAQGNLYKRLKEEIDLSRRMYEDRIPESVRAGNDFFHEELVRILADGRAEALGI